LTITRTIIGDIATSVTLQSMTRADTGATVTLSPALPQAFTDAGDGSWTYVFTPPIADIGYNYVFTVEWSDNSTETANGNIGGTAPAPPVPPPVPVPSLVDQSQFEILFTANTGAFYEGSFGLKASYQSPDNASPIPTGLDGNPLMVRVHRDPMRQVDATVRKNGEMQEAEIILRQSQLAKPVRFGRITVRGVEVWTIETTPILVNGEFRCTCTRGGIDRLMERRAKQ